jgi:hypothetical protein
MTRDHELIAELLAAEALGGLEPPDREILDRELAAHGDCEECRAIAADFTEVAGMLALSLDPAKVTTTADQVLLAAGATIPDAPAIRLVEVDVLETEGPRAERPPARPRWWRGLAAVAAALVLFVAGWIARGTGGAGQPRLVRFTGGSGDLAAAYTPGDRGIVLFGSNLQPLPAGQVYELWTIEGTTPASAACFSPQNGGVLRFVDRSVGAADLLAVTVESSSCPSAPTTDPILTAKLS